MYREVQLLPEQVNQESTLKKTQTHLVLIFCSNIRKMSRNFYK